MKRDLPLRKQVFLLEKDTSTMCRLLGLYAARGLDVSDVRYEHAAPKTMMLTVTAQADDEVLRVLLHKAASAVGVIEAAMMSTQRRHGSA